MGSKSRPLSYQFLNAINIAFGGGGKNKHSIKRDAQKKGVSRPKHHVYGYADKAGLTALSSQLGRYVKENYPGIKLVRDIKVEMAQSFLNKKAETCDQETLKTYTSHIRKLSHLINHAYKVNSNWSKQISEPISLVCINKKRNVVMTETQYRSLWREANKEGRRSRAKWALPLARKFGLRVSECVKLQPRDINFKERKIHVHEGKGQKSRDLEYKPNQEGFLKELVKGLKEDERIINLKEDTVNKQLARWEEAVGIREIFKDAKTGIHSIRKLRAQEYYDTCKAAGMSQEVALSATSVYLGHGEDRTERDETIHQYVLNL